jgi:hypothetical protein
MFSRGWAQGQPQFGQFRGLVRRATRCRFSQCFFLSWKSQAAGWLVAKSGIPNAEEDALYLAQSTIPKVNPENRDVIWRFQTWTWSLGVCVSC